MGDRDNNKTSYFVFLCNPYCELATVLMFLKCINICNHLGNALSVCKNSSVCEQNSTVISCQ